jgi:lactoylglutathione lyase
MYLYEAHLPVSDTEAARRFYVEIVGLQFAHRDLTRDVVFLWAGADRRSMLGLWGPSTTLGSEFHKCHIAFNVSLDELLAAGERLNAAGVQTQNFGGEKTTEPSVIGWMPSAQLLPRPRQSLARAYLPSGRISTAEVCRVALRMEAASHAA